VIGCGGEPEVQPVAPAPAPEPVRKQIVVGGEGGAASVGLQFRGISPLYQGYFGDEKLVGQLGVALGACADGAVDVVVSYSNETRIGTVFVQTDPKSAVCVPTRTGEEFDLSPMVPIATALAQYRDALSANYDLRIASFKTGVTWLSGTNLCSVWAGGQYPPDGSTFSPCLDFAGNATCGKGARDEGVVLLQMQTPEDTAYVRRCFGL